MKETIVIMQKHIKEIEIQLAVVKGIVNALLMNAGMDQKKIDEMFEECRNIQEKAYDEILKKQVLEDQK